VRLGGVSNERGKSAPESLDAISGRNKLLGTVTRIRESGLLAEVTLRVADQTLTAIITRAAVNQLGLKSGSPAYALVKATEVMIIRA
jgi:molybdate transport system regulatory protein